MLRFLSLLVCALALVVMVTTTADAGPFGRRGGGGCSSGGCSTGGGCNIGSGSQGCNIAPSVRASEAELVPLAPAAPLPVPLSRSAKPVPAAKQPVQVATKPKRVAVLNKRESLAFCAPRAVETIPVPRQMLVAK